MESPRKGAPAPVAPAAYAFDRPAELQATLPAERRGAARDDVRLLVTAQSGNARVRHAHHAFTGLPELLAPGDVLVVNRSATLPASLPATSSAGAFLVNLSTRYGERLWLAELRWSHAEPGPVPVAPGEALSAAGVPGQVVAGHPRIPRLAFVAFEEPIEGAMARAGSPIRYGYVDAPLPLAAYQTIFADTPGSAEMPSAARPFTERTLAALAARGVGVTRVTLHTGVSSLDAQDHADPEDDLYAEPFDVPAEAADAIAAARARGGRVIAVGTTVIRALESAWRDGRVQPTRGFTRRVVRPGSYRGAADALLTGLHDAGSSHLAMLRAVAGPDAVAGAYRAAVAAGYLWHEFGDVHLLWSASAEGARR